MLETSRKLKGRRRERERGGGGGDPSLPQIWSICKGILKKVFGGVHFGAFCNVKGRILEDNTCFVKKKKALRSRN